MKIFRDLKFFSEHNLPRPLEEEWLSARISARKKEAGAGKRPIYNDNNDDDNDSNDNYNDNYNNIDNDDKIMTIMITIMIMIIMIIIVLPRCESRQESW